MNLTHPLSIALLLLGGSIFIPRAGPWLGRPARILLTLALAAVAFLLGLLAVSKAPFTITLAHWEDFTGTDEAIVFQSTVLTGRWMVLVLFMGLAVTLAALDEPWDGPTDEYITALVGVPAALLLFSMANNFLTWLAAWALVDLVWLFVIGLPGHSQWPWLLGLLQGVGLFSLLGAVLLVWQTFRVISFVVPGIPLFAVLFLTIALVVRMGVYPLHFPARAHNNVPSRVRAFFPLVNVAASGLWLMLWVPRWGTQWLPFSPAPVLAAGLVATGLLAWWKRHPTQRTIFLSGWLGLLILWALWAGRPEVAGHFIWGGTLSLAVLAFHGGEGQRWEGATLPAILAALVFLGIPGSGLAALGDLMAQAWAAGHAELTLAALVGLMCVTVALIQHLADPLPTVYQRSRWTGMTLLALGAWPPFGRLLWLLPPFDQAKPVTPWPWWLGLLVLGWAGGLLLWRFRPWWEARNIVWRTGVAVLDLEWGWRLLERGTAAAAVSVRGVARVVEGENYGWLLLFLLVALVLLAE